MGKINKKTKFMQKLLNKSSGRFSVPLSKLEQRFAKKGCRNSFGTSISSSTSTAHLSQTLTFDNDDDNEGKGILVDKRAETVTPSARKLILKKAKLRLKHKNLMKKFDLLRSELETEQARRNREKTAIVGDLQPLKDALPSLDELYDLSRNRRDLHSNSATEPKNLTKSEKIRLNRGQFIDKVNSYQQLLNDDDFKRNPRDAIRLHVKYTYIR